ncbi:MAG: alpha/beta hydrolase [Clostridia bacterium]|nr:alpha/beta hydrolase [Clostridia bacterium]
MGKKGIISVLGATAGLIGAVDYTIFNAVMSRNSKLVDKAGGFLNKKPDDAIELPPEEEDERIIWFNQQKFEEFTISNERNQSLKGYLLKADEPSDVYVFCSHGYRCNGKREFRFITKYYHDKGFNVFLVDHQASGQSEGSYIGFGYYEYQDCLTWLNWLINNYGNNIKIILHGVSMGSATVMMMSGSDKLPENVRFIVADCGYTSAWHEFEHNISFLGKAEYIILYGSDIFNKLISGYHFKDADALSAVQRAKVPMLFVHGTKDDFVPTRMGKELYMACNSDYKDLLLIEGAAHAESYQTNSEAYNQKLDEFIEKFIK